MYDNVCRRFTVSSLGYCNDVIPIIRFKGKWLRNLGFNIGDRLEVICKNETMIIKRIKNV
jgi:hypothetical protein